MKKIIRMLELSICSLVLVLSFAFGVNALTSHSIGKLTITSSYSRTTDKYYYTDAAAYAQYDISSVSQGSNGYASFSTTLQRKSTLSWKSLGKKEKQLSSGGLSVYQRWSDIKEGSFRYIIKGIHGTTYVSSAVVGSA